jgi:hypothetical protein
MAQRKKRPTARRGKSAARGKARKTSNSARRKAAKRTIGRSKPRKSLAKAKLKRAGAKKVTRRKAQPMKPPSTPAVETAIVDAIEEPASGAIVVTEVEATEVREPSADPEQTEGQDSTPPKSEES